MVLRAKCLRTMALHPLPDPERHLALNLNLVTVQSSDLLTDTFTVGFFPSLPQFSLQFWSQGLPWGNPSYGTRDFGWRLEICILISNLDDLMVQGPHLAKIFTNSLQRVRVGCAGYWKFALEQPQCMVYICAQTFTLTHDRFKCLTLSAYKFRF